MITPVFPVPRSSDRTLPATANPILASPSNHFPPPKDWQFPSSNCLKFEICVNRILIDVCIWYLFSFWTWFWETPFILLYLVVHCVYFHWYILLYEYRNCVLFCLVLGQFYWGWTFGVCFTFTLVVFLWKYMFIL